jgi:hypothetical protein
MENIINIIFWAIAIVIILGSVIVFLSLGFAFGDKVDMYEDDKGNIHFRCNGDLWDDGSRFKPFSKIDWNDVQRD